MSLRDLYTTAAHAEADGNHPLTKPLNRALADLRHDLKFIAKATEAGGNKGLTRFFAGLKAGGSKGRREDNVLVFKLDETTLDIQERYWSAAQKAADELRNTVGAHLHGASYVEAHLSPRAEHIYEGMLRRAAHEAAQEKLRRLRRDARDLSAYRTIHEACGDSRVDMRVELSVDVNIGHKEDIRQKGGGYTWDGNVDSATTRLTTSLRVYLDQPFSASTDADRYVEVEKKPKPETHDHLGPVAKGRRGGGDACTIGTGC
jgi:hypothetical protein